MAGAVALSSLTSTTAARQASTAPRLPSPAQLGSVSLASWRWQRQLVEKLDKCAGKQQQQDCYENNNNMYTYAHNIYAGIYVHANQWRAFVHKQLWLIEATYLTATTAYGYNNNKNNSMQQ